MLVKSLNSSDNLVFASRKLSKRSDIPRKVKLSANKVIEAQQLRNFIDDLQLIPEIERSYYSNVMMKAKFKPKTWKGFVSKILKIV